MECIMNKEIDDYTDRILEYISGFVCKKLMRTLKCDICVSLLIGEPDSNSLIYVNTRGLKYASSSVTNIIKKLIK